MTRQASDTSAISSGFSIGSVTARDPSSGTIWDNVLAIAGESMLPEKMESTRMFAPARMPGETAKRMLAAPYSDSP